MLLRTDRRKSAVLELVNKCSRHTNNLELHNLKKSCKCRLELNNKIVVA